MTFNMMTIVIFAISVNIKQIFTIEMCATFT